MDTKHGSDIEFFMHVFDRNEPLEPKAVQLEIPLDTTKELFEFLLHLFTESMKFKYSHDGETVDLKLCTDGQIRELNRYFMSFGLCFICKVYHVNQFDIGNNYNKDKYTEPISLDNMIPYKSVVSDKLNDYKFQIKVDDEIYVIFFSFI
jgi:hypothetical protein